jgi:mannose/fructose/sorbose-specific phosphotransferase system IIA component
VITVVLASHGRLAEAMLQTVETIAGSQQHVAALGLLPGGEPHALEAGLAELLAREKSLLILCDLRYGTPYNVTMRLSAGRPGVRVLGGLSLPMALEAALSADVDDVDELAARVVHAAVRDLGVATAQSAVDDAA